VRRTERQREIESVRQMERWKETGWSARQTEKWKET
jgi:hypothetical protein